MGLLLPGITEDDGPATEPTSPMALAFFLAAVLLVSSLAGTTVLLSRAGTERPRTPALWFSAVRLALLASAACYVVYRISTVEAA